MIKTITVHAVVIQKLSPVIMPLSPQRIPVEKPAVIHYVQSQYFLEVTSARNPTASKTCYLGRLPYINQSDDKLLYLQNFKVLKAGHARKPVLWAKSQGVSDAFCIFLIMMQANPTNLVPPQSSPTLKFMR